MSGFAKKDFNALSMTPKCHLGHGYHFLEFFEKKKMSDFAQKDFKALSMTPEIV